LELLERGEKLPDAEDAKVTQRAQKEYQIDINKGVEVETNKN
jgi:hypothetical protein